MSRRVLVGVGVVLRSVVVACMVAAGALAWRVAQGPVSIDFLVPQLEAALAEASGGLRVRVGSASLAWDRSVHNLELRAHHVRLMNGGDSEVMTIPEVSIGVEPRALLSGSLHVGSVVLIEPRLRLVRGPDGRLLLVDDNGRETDLGALPSFASVGGEASSSWAMPRIGVRDAAVTLVERASGDTWEGMNVTLDMHGQGGVVIGRLGGAFACGTGARSWPVKATVLFRPSARRVSIPQLSLGLEGRGVLRLRGHVESTADGYAVVAKTSLADVAARDLGRDWPEAIAPAVRRWIVDNIRSGRIRNARARVAATLPDASPRGARIESAVGFLRFEGVTARYVKGMPAATSLSGTGRYTLDGTRFVITGGQIEGVEVVLGSLRFTPPAVQPPRLALGLTARGPLPQVLAVLGHEPVGVTRALGREASDFVGVADMRANLDIPLAPGAESRAVGVTASAALRGVGVSNVAGSWSVREGDLALELRDRTLTMAGTVQLEGVPVRLELRRQLGKPAGTQVDLEARVDDGGRRSLGLATANWVVGPVSTRARILQRDAATSTIDLDADLTPASLDLPAVALDKRAEVPGRIRARLLVAGDTVTAVESGRLTVGENEVTVNATRSDDSKTWRTIDVEARLAPLAGMAKGANATLTVRPAESRHRFALESNDAGMLFRALGYADGRGDRFTCEGTVDLSAPNLTLDGSVRVERFTLTRSPILARLLTLTSLSGIARALDRDGIAFDQLDGSFTARGSEVTLTRLTARGPSLAIRLDGSVDRAANRLAVQGALVPSYYGLNTAAASIPVVGKVVTGVHGEGVQVIAFRVDGSFASPEVRLNPAASLAPGVLRDLIGVLPGRRQ